MADRRAAQKRVSEAQARVLPMRPRSTAGSWMRRSGEQHPSLQSPSISELELFALYPEMLSPRELALLEGDGFVARTGGRYELTDFGRKWLEDSRKGAGK